MIETSNQESNLPAEGTQEFLSGKLAQVDVVEIERQLSKLWQSAASTETEQGPGVGRACVLNLVLSSADSDAEFSAGNLLDEITITHPCRAMLAISRPNAQLSLDAWVSARCHPLASSKTKQICCEQITVRFEGDGTNELPSVILPLLIPDLPTFLWWRMDTLNRPALDPFLSSIDRLIVDSGRPKCNLRFFTGLTSCLSDYGSKVAISDLSWRRILPFRKAIAYALEDPQSIISIEDLDKLERVTIETAIALDASSDYLESLSSQGLLLIAWLASRLSWQPRSAACTEDASCRLIFKKDTRTINVEWKSQPSKESYPGSLMSVSLFFSGDRILTLNLNVVDGTPHVVQNVMAKGKSLAQIVVEGPDYTEASLIGKELEVLGRDKVYEEALQVASRIVSLI